MIWFFLTDCRRWIRSFNKVLHANIVQLISSRQWSHLPSNSRGQHLQCGGHVAVKNRSTAKCQEGQAGWRVMGWSCGCQHWRHGRKSVWGTILWCSCQGWSGLAFLPFKTFTYGRSPQICYFQGKLTKFCLDKINGPRSVWSLQVLIGL